MNVPLPALLIALSSAVLGAVFVAADAALAHLTPARKAALLEQEGLAHKAALERYQAQSIHMHAVYTVGRVICAALTAVLLAEVVETWVPGPAGTALTVFTTLTLYAPFSSVLATVARKNSDTWGPLLASNLRVFEWVLLPLAYPLAVVSERLAEGLSESEESDSSIATAEVEHFVDQVERSGVVGAEPAAIIRNVLEFEDLRARDVMVARTRIEAIDLATPLETVRRLVAESGHSRYPVFEGQLDNVIGILVAKDVFKAEAAPDDDAPAADDASAPTESRLRTLADVVRRDVIFIPESQKLVSLLRDMRQKRQHLAVVVDEFGGTSGIVTMEDIIEEIVGDIRDEHDEVEHAPIQDLGGDRWLVAGSVPVTDLGAYLGFALDEGDEERTLAHIFDGAELGSTHTRWGLTVTVQEVRGGRVERVELERTPSSSVRPSARPA
jgi:CBS domain containing-hemolysin-like protein